MSAAVELISTCDWQSTGAGSSTFMLHTRTLHLSAHLSSKKRSGQTLSTAATMVRLEILFVQVCSPFLQKCPRSTRGYCQTLKRRLQSGTPTASRNTVTLTKQDSTSSVPPLPSTNTSQPKWEVFELTTPAANAQDGASPTRPSKGSPCRYDNV